MKYTGGDFDEYDEDDEIIEDETGFGGYADPYRVVIDAHCDEISWVVREITKEGLLRVKRNGGTDNELKLELRDGQGNKKDLKLRFKQ